MSSIPGRRLDLRTLPQALQSISGANLCCCAKNLRKAGRFSEGTASLAARIDAAADSGDVETAAEVLDLMVDSGLEIDLAHVNSAIRSCWGWQGEGRKAAKAAKYFFNLLPQFHLRPDIVTFSALIGALRTGHLDDILSAYAEMKTLQIQPDSAFAETYLVTLLQKDRKGILRTVDDAVDFLRPKPQERLQAARKALSYFDNAEIRLTALCSIIQKGLTRLYP